MTDSRRGRAVAIGVMAVAAVVFLLGITWGLPSSRVDEYLFGSEPVWSGERIYLLSGGWENTGGLGADVDRDPIVDRSEPLLLSGSDRQRAQIIRRYRLYSYNPDEMITLRALGQMSGSQLDPKLYQYGGLWVYPVGAMLKVAQVVRYIPSPPAGTMPLVYYLEHPDAFGRFYVVMRLYAAMWGVAGAWAVFWIAQRLTKDALIAGAAALAFVFLPAVMNGAHEAKPHLPGAVLMLFAVMAAATYVRRGKPVWWISAGALCGAAAGMVLTAFPIFLIIPVMAALRRKEPVAQRIGTGAAALLIGIIVYFISNPFVGINLMNASSEGGRALRSNLGNTKAMYSLSPRGLAHGISLIGLGASPLLSMLGIAGAVVLILIARKQKGKAEGAASASAGKEDETARALPWLLFVPAGVITLQFLVMAGGKPAEYARFAIFPAIALVMLGAWAAAVISRGNPIFRQLLPALLVVSTLPYGLAYFRAFVRDTRPQTSRIQSADELPPTGRVMLTHEPAPYNTPPVNLFRRDLVLVPPGYKVTPGSGDLLVYPVDVPVPNTADGPRRLPFQEAPGSLDQFTTPITWANKTFAVEGLGSAPVE